MTNPTERQLLTPMTLRAKNNLTQRQVAQAIDVRESTVSAWERGNTIPHLPPSKVKRLMEIYQCSLEELIQAFEGGEQR